MELLEINNMTLYRLEQKSGIPHGTMCNLISERNKDIRLKTVMQIAKGFGMTLIEFLDYKLFDFDNFDLE